MERLFIVCKNEKEESKVLEELEKQGKKWSVGKKPTELNYFSSNDREYAIIVDGSVIYCTANAIMTIASITYYKNAKKISAAEFLKKNKETIVIYRNGAETIALEKNTGKKAVAKCHADDTYSFEIGAKLALERLFSETVREVKRHAEVGEYIKIVNPIAARGYKKGDIMKVEDTTQHRMYVMCGETGNFCIKHDEYVVLENYKPEEKPQEYYTGKVVCVKGNTGYTVGRIYEIKDGKLTDDDGELRPKGKTNKIGRLEDYAAAKFIELVEQQKEARSNE